MPSPTCKNKQRTPQHRIVGYAGSAWNKSVKHEDYLL
eukprot:COSAG02_NODE_4412_length_5386_cov_8.158880_2_plen_37_part_00